MASIKKRTDGKYRARYRDAAGKEHARHFTRKADAQRWLDEVTASVVTGQYVDPRAGRVRSPTTSSATRGARCGRAAPRQRSGWRPGRSRSPMCRCRRFAAPMSSSG